MFRQTALPHTQQQEQQQLSQFYDLTALPQVKTHLTKKMLIYHVRVSV